MGNTLHDDDFEYRGQGGNRQKASSKVIEWYFDKSSFELKLSKLFKLFFRDFSAEAEINGLTFLQ
ncbi:hypothetical protein C9J03_00020 [Photobacterium gaetbulicola]|nr:hypothetical protein [Photobacterium gaetbulicola]PSU14512.1 hypothetical protein C9J03_00020 [Photobacterium gaetbulicola]